MLVGQADVDGLAVEAAGAKAGVGGIQLGHLAAQAAGHGSGGVVRGRGAVGERAFSFFSFSVLFCFLFSFYLFISFSVLFYLKYLGIL